MSDFPAPPPGSLPTSGASAILNDTTPVPAAPGVTTSDARGAAMAELARLQADPAVRERLLRGDGALANEVARLQRTISTPSGLFIGGEETPAQAEQHVAGWDAYVGMSLSEAFGPELGPKIEAEQRAGGPISPYEYRQARAAIEEMKSDSEFQQKLRSGNVKAKARWSLAHRQVVRPVKTDAA